MVVRMVLKPRSPGNSRAAPALKPNSRDIWDAATKGDDAAITHLLEQGVAVDATDGVSDRRHTTHTTHTVLPAPPTL
eukprot:scaffold80839_cov45-Phaeocystis_antarctica.AAC.3